MAQTAAMARWSGIVREHAESGMSVRDFAAVRGLRPATLAWWRWRLRQGGSKAQEFAGFAEIMAVTIEASPVRIRVGQRWIVEVDPGADVDFVARLLERLG